MKWLSAVLGKTRPTADEKIEAVTLPADAPGWAVTHTGLWNALGHKSYETEAWSAPNSAVGSPDAPALKRRTEAQ